MKFILESTNTELLTIEETSCLYDLIHAIVDGHDTPYEIGVTELSKAIAIASLHIENDADIKDHAKIAETLTQAQDLDVFTITVAE